MSGLGGRAVDLTHHYHRPAAKRHHERQVKDEQSGECFRADKLLEDFIDRLIETSPTMPTCVP